MPHDRQPVPRGRLDRAREIVRLAWTDLPPSHRALLEAVGAGQHDVVDAPLGDVVDRYVRSAGFSGVDEASREGLDLALGVWIRELRIIVIDAGHEKLAGVDDSTYEAMIARVAWHEWGHALSIARASEDDILAGARLIDLAPPGVADLIRTAGYREREYTHELVAEIYALLMARRRRGQTGQPDWLGQELFDLVRRTTGWTT